MGKLKKTTRINPFYVLLVVAGVAFCVTACAFGLTLVRQMHFRRSGIVETASLLIWLDRYGVTLLMVELLALAVGTFAAIGLDDLFTDSAPGPTETRTRSRPPNSPPSSE